LVALHQVTDHIFSFKEFQTASSGEVLFAIKIYKASDSALLLIDRVLYISTSSGLIQLRSRFSLNGILTHGKHKEGTQVGAEYHAFSSEELVDESSEIKLHSGSDDTALDKEKLVFTLLECFGHLSVLQNIQELLNR
jgi:hypothetical protein